ncbi:conserved hypothetical protein [Burkholderia ambifaria MEX-5]|uniref:Uncharacterized protein n=1 Tax=Burkholderia ambifaria MEX-5 TaxID=396597 RepID=B1T8C5_9BURK|nr:conserved hypothetical protein [Burkholderia ambifaria MEX-5]
MALDLNLDRRQHGQDDQVPDGRDHQQRNHFEIAAIDHLHRIEQLGHREHVHHRCAFRERDEIVERGRQDGAHRLRQHDPRGLAATRQAERRGCFELSLVDRENAAADHLGGKRRVIQRETEHGREERADQVGGRRVEPHDVGEWHAEPHVFVQVAEVVEDQQQHDQRNRPEQPHEGPRARGEHARTRQPRQRDERAEREAEYRAEQRQHQRAREPGQHRRRQKPFGEYRPTPLRVAEDRMQRERDQHEREHGAGRARAVAGRHDAQARAGVADAGRRKRRQCAAEMGRVAHVGEGPRSGRSEAPRMAARRRHACASAASSCFCTAPRAAWRLALRGRPRWSRSVLPGRSRL